MDIHQLLVVTLCTCHVANFCMCLKTTGERQYYINWFTQLKTSILIALSGKTLTFEIQIGPI